MSMPYLFKTLGIGGLLLITRGIFVHKELARDEWSLLGGVLLLVYSIYLNDLVFIILQLVFISANGYQIYKIKNFK